MIDMWTRSMGKEKAFRFENKRRLGKEEEKSLEKMKKKYTDV